MVLDLQFIVMTLLSGTLVGVLLGTFGGGGSILAAPLLLYAVGVSDIHLALGTSAAAVAAIAFVGLVGHGRAGRVQWKYAFVFAGAGLAGAVLGSSLAMATNDDLLLLAFAGAMAAVALTMFRKPRSTGHASSSFSFAAMLRIVPVGVTVGTASGFFGIGGGFLIVPGLMATTGMTLGHAAGASLVSVATFGTVASINYGIAGFVSVPVVLLMLTGGGIGGMVGLRLATALAGREELGRKLFASMILVVAAYVAVDAARALMDQPESSSGPNAAASTLPKARAYQRTPKDTRPEIAWLTSSNCV